jgi:hypothetical protein
MMSAVPAFSGHMPSAEVLALIDEWVPLILAKGRAKAEAKLLGNPLLRFLDPSDANHEYYVWAVSTFVLRGGVLPAEDKKEKEKKDKDKDKKDKKEKKDK